MEKDRDAGDTDLKILILPNITKNSKYTKYVAHKNKNCNYCKIIINVILIECCDLNVYL